jgi:hypothetical protein
MFGMVETSEWDLSGMLDRERAARLLDPPSADKLIRIIAEEVRQRAQDGRGGFKLQPGKEMKGCSRATAMLSISAVSFDLLFNGRSGYRAQFYLSVENGRLFTRLLIEALLETVKILVERENASAWGRVEHSLSGPWSKIWMGSDGVPFQDAAEGEFRPRRWTSRKTIWLRAPLPLDPSIDLKGTWVGDDDGHYYQDTQWKRDRDETVSEIGGA